MKNKNVSLLINFEAYQKENYQELRELFSSDQEFLESLIDRILSRPPKNMERFSKLVRLNEEKHEALKELSTKLNISMTELIKNALNQN